MKPVMANTRMERLRIAAAGGEAGSKIDRFGGGCPPTPSRRQPPIATTPGNRPRPRACCNPNLGSLAARLRGGNCQKYQVKRAEPWAAEIRRMEVAARVRGCSN